MQRNSNAGAWVGWGAKGPEGPPGPMGPEGPPQGPCAALPGQQSTNQMARSKKTGARKLLEGRRGVGVARSEYRLLPEDILLYKGILLAARLI